MVPSPGNPQSLNRYAYTLNNPLKYIDPTGHGEDCGPTGHDKCESDPPPPPPPPWYAQPLERLDNWLWATKPSVIGIQVGGTLGADPTPFALCMVGGNVSGNAALVFNWRSGEVSLLLIPSAEGRAGTPRVLYGDVHAGTYKAWGVSRNEHLRGLGGHISGSATADAAANLGVIGSEGAGWSPDMEAATKKVYNFADFVRGLGGTFRPMIDPNSERAIRNETLSVAIGGNLLVNGFDFEGDLGADYTIPIPIYQIPGWPLRQ